MMVAAIRKIDFLAKEGYKNLMNEFLDMPFSSEFICADEPSDGQAPLLWKHSGNNRGLFWPH